jgi:hypothetical protein
MAQVLSPHFAGNKKESRSCHDRFAPGWRVTAPSCRACCPDTYVSDCRAQSGCRTHIQPELPTNASGFRLASDSLSTLACRSACDRSWLPFHAPWAHGRCWLGPGLAGNSLAGALEQPAAASLNQKTVKERVCFTLPADEVNRILSSVYRLFSIECSSSTGHCQDLVQARNHLSQQCNFTLYFRGCDAIEVCDQDEFRARANCGNPGKNIVQRGDCAMRIFAVIRGLSSRPKAECWSGGIGGSVALP